MCDSCLVTSLRLLSATLLPATVRRELTSANSVLLFAANLSDQYNITYNATTL
jgi:hypothetical protein